MVWARIFRWVDDAAANGLRVRKLALCAIIGLVLSIPHPTLYLVLAGQGIPHVVMTLFGLVVLLLMPAVTMLSLAWRLVEARSGERSQKYSPAKLAMLWFGLFLVHAGYSHALSRSGDVMSTMGGKNIPFTQAVFFPIAGLFQSHGLQAGAG